MYTFEQRQEIRDNYQNFSSENRSPYSYAPRCGFIMSPAEEYMWNTIRSNGLPFYPEFPVLQYFIDFADPVKKIGIEVDGKEWHKDKEKDKNRQDHIEKMGWKIYRVDGGIVRFDLPIEEDRYVYDSEYRDQCRKFMSSSGYDTLCTIISLYKGYDLNEYHTTIQDRFRNDEY